jgi:ribulose-phosphate 3-epimerase
MNREIRLTPSILNADFADLESEIQRIAEVSDLLHLDVMDNIFVPNFTFDFDSASTLIKKSSLPVDAHLMVANVDAIAPAYAEAGCASVTVHAEATESISKTLRAIKSEGARAGLALKPGTDFSDYSKFLNEADMFLVMTVEPGFGGQKFMEDMLPKISQIRKAIGRRPIWLQVDGGISLQTIAMAAEAGADTFVAGSAVFTSDDPAAMVSSLRELAQSSIR